MTIKEAVDKLVYAAFNSEKITGSKSQRSVCDLTIFYKKKLTKDSQTKKVVDLASYIHNKVISILKDEAFYSLEPSSGTILITDNIRLLGQCLSTGKLVNFITEWPCKKGDKFPYHRIGTKYYLENYFPGAAKKPNDYLFGESGNFLLQRSEFCSEYIDKDGYLEKFGEHKLGKTNRFNYPKEEVWYKSSNSELSITYVKNGIYTERKIEKEEITLEIDCSAYLTPTTDSTGTVSHEGAASGTYIIKAPVVTRIIHVGHIAILQVLREKRTTMIMANTVGYTEYCYPIETGSKAYNSVSIFSLIIIDTTAQTTNLLDYTPTSTWFNLPPITIAGGYLDIQIDKETGDLLLIKSDSTISSSNITVDYFDTDGSLTSGIYDHPQGEDYDTAIHYPTSDGSQSCTTRQVGFKLYSAKLGIASLDLENLTLLYTQAATISSLQGKAVVGGCRSMTFTQEPENFNIYFKVHKVGYRNINYDFIYVPSNGDDTRYEMWQRTLTSLGVVEILDINGIEKFNVLTTELGIYFTMSHRTSMEDNPAVKLNTAMTFNHICPICKSYAFRSDWPQLEATFGSPDAWMKHFNMNRTDYPTSGFANLLLETRFADVFFGSGFTRPIQYIPVINPMSMAEVIPYGDTGFIRNDPDLFMSFSEAGNEGVLFVITGNYDIQYGRETADSTDDWNGYLDVRSIAAWMASETFPMLSKFKDRGNRPENMIAWDDEPEIFPHGAHQIYKTYRPAVGSLLYPIQYSEVGFSHFSIFRVSKWHAFCLLNRQYFHIKYDLSGPTELSREVTENSTFILITSDSDYHPHPIAENPNETTCLWTWTPKPTILDDENGSLKIASLENRARIKQLEDLMDNALQ